MSWPWMWRRRRSRANSSIISVWGRRRGSRNCGSSDSCSSTGGGIRAGVRPTSRGRRRVVHPQPEVVPSACLNHVWAREGKEMKNGRGRVSDEKKYDGFELKMKGEGGGGGGVFK